MNRSFFIRPAKPGLIVRDPVSGSPLPEAGAEKPCNQYWLRRLKDGEVVKATAPAGKKKSASTEGGR